LYAKNTINDYGKCKVVPVLFLTEHHAMKALDGSEWSASCHGRFTSKERAPGTHWIYCFMCTCLEHFFLILVEFFNLTVANLKTLILMKRGKRGLG